MNPPLPSDDGYERAGMALTVDSSETGGSVRVSPEIPANRASLRGARCLRNTPLDAASSV
jgi:hypothetical protein